MNEKLEQVRKDLDRLTDAIYESTGEWFDFTPSADIDGELVIEVTNPDDRLSGPLVKLCSVDEAYEWADEFIEAVRS